MTLDLDNDSLESNQLFLACMTSSPLLIPLQQITALFWHEILKFFVIGSMKVR